MYQITVALLQVPLDCVDVRVHIADTVVEYQEIHAVT